MCGVHEHARRAENQYAWQQAHGAQTLETYHWEQEWHARGPDLIDAEMARRVTRWLATKLKAAAVQPMVPRVRPSARWKYTDADLLAAWIATPAPRTVDTMAAGLGLTRGDLYRVLSKHQIPVARLRALTAAPA